MCRQKKMYNDITINFLKARTKCEKPNNRKKKKILFYNSSYGKNMNLITKFGQYMCRYIHTILVCFINILLNMKCKVNISHLASYLYFLFYIIYSILYYQ